MKTRSMVDIFVKGFKREDIGAHFEKSDVIGVVIDVGNEINIFLDDFSQYKLLVNKLYADMKKLEYLEESKGSK